MQPAKNAIRSWSQDRCRTPSLRRNLSRRRSALTLCYRGDMTQITCSALLFDLDGVLIDSTPAVTRVWTQWAIAHGFDPDDVVLKAHGRPSIATIRDYLPHADHEAENREVERREIADLEGVVTLPGARELLNALPPDRWTIVTSCTRPLAAVRLRAAGLPIPKRFADMRRCEERKTGSRAVSEGRIVARSVGGGLRRGGGRPGGYSRRQGCGGSGNRLQNHSFGAGAQKCRRRLDCGRLQINHLNSRKQSQPHPDARAR